MQHRAPLIKSTDERIRTARLKKKAETGDKKTDMELERMENTLMVPVGDKRQCQFPTEDLINMEHSMELDLFNIAQEYAETHAMLKDKSVAECELMYPDVEWDEVKRAFLRCELEYLMRLNNKGKHDVG